MDKDRNDAIVLPQPGHGSNVSPELRKKHMEVTLRYWSFAAGLLFALGAVAVFLFVDPARNGPPAAVLSALASGLITFAQTGRRN